MPSKKSNITFQQINKYPSPITNLSEDNSIEQDIKDDENNHQRRLPLPTKLSFEENLTNLIEKESPLLQSELLTAEHELSVLRSRLAVNEGVTAVTGSILESLKEQFESHHKLDKTTSTFDMTKTNTAHQQSSSSIQTSPSLEELPELLEIHYDAESPKSPYFIIKAVNSFWLAQPINNSDVESHLKKFSSPQMKRATMKLPENFQLDTDIEDIDKDSISEEDDNSIFDRDEQLSEMKTIRSSSLFQQIDQFERFDDKIDEIYSSIDCIKHKKLTQNILNNLQKQIHELKFILNNIHLNKQDELRIEYEFDELENLFKHEDYHFIELFEQNLNELQHLIEQIRLKDSSIQNDLVTEFENKLESIQNKTKTRLIPENPVITSDVFFEGDKISKGKKPSPSNTVRLIPEDPQINASSFYEGDIHRSFYPHPPEPEKKVLIPERPLVSREVFYEGDRQRSMFTERSTVSPPTSINNLREIMSDLMLAASWSKRPPKFEKQQTKDEVEIHAESFITTEEQHTKSPLCEIIHEVENFSIIPPSILIESTNEDMVIIEKTLDNDEISADITFILVSPPSNENLVMQTSDNLVSQEEEEEEEADLYYQTAVQIVNDVLETIFTKYDNELNLIKSTSSSDNEEENSSSFSLSDDEENEKLIPQISDQPYLSVTDVVTSKSTQELGNLVQELQTLEHQIHDIHPLSSSSSLSSDLSIPQLVTTKSVNELTNLVSELQNVEEKLEDKLDSPLQILSSPISSKSFNELGGLMNELKTVTNRIHQEIFTSKNIDSLSKDLSKYRRDSQPIINNHREEEENKIVQNMIDQIIKEAQHILLTESSTNLPQTTMKIIPSIVVDQRRLPYHQSTATSISDDLELSREDSTGDKTFELAAQLDYLRRMSRYENLLDQHEQLQKNLIIQNNPENISNKQSTDSLDYHSIEDNEQNNSKVTTNQHFQSAYDLHDEEKSKLVRSPELYNIDNVIKHDQRSLLTNSQIQYRTLSESALAATDESKRQSLTTTTSNDASAEFLTTISKDNSMELIQQRISTPFDDVLEKESSPEHSESSNLPLTAFSDTFEPTSSCQRPLAFGTSNEMRPITEHDYETAANDLVNQVLNDIMIELNDEQDENSSLSNKINSTSTSSEDDNILEENEDEGLFENKPMSPKTSLRSSFSKILRRAQTDTTDFDITPSPVALKPPLIRRNSQSDTETYFRAVSPGVNDYIQMNNSSSDDEKSSNKTRHLSAKYSGEGEESSGGQKRNIQRRKRSNELSNSYESPSIKNVSFKFETNENYVRQESLDSPSKDSNEKLILKVLQENILRTNLESFQIDLKFNQQERKNSHSNTYSSTTKKSLSYDDYDAGSETDRDDLKIHNKFLTSSIDTNIKNLLDDLIETINENSSISSQSDATTVILNSNKTSLDNEENYQTNKYSSLSHSVIDNQETFTSSPKKQSSIPSFSNTQLTEHNTKKKFRSYPGSLAPFTSSTTSTTSQSGKQHFDE